jgi:SEC-C motif-containing protein
MIAPPCPCGSGLTLADCCGPRIDNTAPAPTAEALMRSRYTAYTQGDAAYLLTTWHPATRPESLQLDETPQPHWIGLTVKRHEIQDAEHAVVEFVARYKISGRAFKLHETSRFVREDDRWYYVDGDVAG